MRRNMLQVITRARRAYREFVSSQRSGNVTLVPSWRSQLTPVLVCASAVDSRPQDPPQQMHGCQSAWQRRRQRGRHEWRIGVSVCYRLLSDGFRDIQWRMWRNSDMTSNDLWTKVKVIHFGTNRFLIYRLRLAVNSNFCSRTHRLATIHNVTDRRRQTGDRRTQHCSIRATVLSTVS